MPYVDKFSFAGGEISPYLYWRSNINKYGASCKHLSNFLVKPQGTASTRWGSESIALIDNYDHFRTISFPIDIDSNFQLLFYGNVGEVSKCEVWSDSRLLDTIETSYLGEELDNIQYFQSYDVIFLFHARHPVQRLERLSLQEFQILPHVFNGGPFDDRNLDTSKIYSIDANQYDATTTYNVGDVVSVGTTYDLDGTTTRVWLRSYYDKYSYYVDVYGTKLSISSVAGIKIGDNLTIKSISELNGDWAIIDIDVANSTLLINTGTEWWEHEEAPENDFAGINLDGDTGFVNGQKFTFYKSSIDDNVDNNPITSTDEWISSPYVQGEFTLSSNFDEAFTADDVGRQIRLNNEVSTSDRGKWETSDEGAYTKVIPAYGTVTFKTEGGIWDGEVVLQHSIDGGISWEDIAVIESVDGTANGAVTREISDFNSLVRGYLRERGPAPSDSGCIYYLEVVGNQYTYLTVKEFIDGKTVIGTCNNYIWSWINTHRWANGTFCKTNGYPSVGTIFEERLAIGGVPAKPTTLYMSAINGFTDFTLGSLATSSVKFSLPSSIRQSIKWLISKQELIIGTDGGEWTIGSRNIDQVLSATNVRAKQHTSVGSEDIQAIPTKELIIFVEKDGLGLRGLAYEFTHEGYATTDLSILASHLTDESVIVDIVYSKGRQPTIWVLLDDGSLLTFSHEPNEGVSAWARQELGGIIKSISVDPQNRLWLIIERSDGTYFERIEEGNYHIDSYQEYETTETTAIYPLRGGEAFTIWDDAWNVIDTKLFGTGSFIKLASTLDVRINIDGVLATDGIEYQKIIGVESNEYFYWLPFGASFTLIEPVTGNILYENIDYTVYDASNATTFDIFDFDTVAGDWDNVRVTADSVIQTRNEGYWVSVDNNLGIIPDGFTKEVVIEKLEATVPEYEFVNNSTMEYLKVRNLYSPACCASSVNKRFGTPMLSEIVTTDVMGMVDLGGPGSTARVSELQLFVTNSIGGEITFEQYDVNNQVTEQYWEPVYDAPYDTVLGEALVPFTGMRIISVNSGHNQQGTFMMVRTDNPQHMNLTHVKIKVVKTSNMSR